MNESLEESMGKALNILLVEDSEADVKITQRAFKKAKFQNKIYTVRDGQEALDYLSGKNEYADRDRFPIPELIISDINMPKLDGLELLKELKLHNDYQSIPIVMLTSSRAHEDIVKSYKHGAANYIPKPLDFEEFENVIEGFNFYWSFLSQLPEK